MTSNYQSLYSESCGRYPYIGKKSVGEEDMRVDFIYQFVKKRHVKIHTNLSVFHTAPDIIGPPKFSNYGEPFQKLNRANNDIDISITPWQYEESVTTYHCVLCPPWDPFRTIEKNYIDIEFHEAVYPIRVSIYEMYNPGEVIRILAQNDSNNEWFELWGTDDKSEIVPPTEIVPPRLFSPPLSHPRNLKTKMLRLFFKNCNRKPLGLAYTKLDAVMLIGTSELVCPKNYEKSLTNLLKKINRIYSPHHEDIHNLTADFKNAHMDIDYLQQHFYEYCTVMKYCGGRQGHVAYSRPSYLCRLVSNRCDSNYAKRAKLSSDESKELSPHNISELPDEILLMILKNLDLMTLCRLNYVNKRFNDLIRDPRLYTRLNIHCSPSAKDFDTLQNIKYFDMARRNMSNIFCYFTSRCKYLQQLDLTKSTFDVEDFKNFLDNCGRRLTHLRLGYCHSIDNLALLKISEICVNLKELNLDYCKGIDDKGFWYLAKLNGLEHLNLRNTHIKAECLYEILQKNQRMREFNFRPGDCIRDTAATEFINLCPNLEVIRLQDYDDLTSQDIDVLADCKNLRKVYLPEFEDPIADDCLHRLLSSWQRLELVTLCRIVLTDHNLKLLTQCKNLKQLQLYRVKLVTPDKCSTILEQCPKLQEFHLTYCNIDDCLVNEWKEIYPHVSIYTLE